MSARSGSKLSEQRVVIVGGTSGIGFGVAQAALDSGAEVLVASSSQLKVDAAVKRLESSRASGRTIDVSSEDALRIFFEETGGFDHLVYTAGDTLQLGAFDKTDMAKAKAGLDVRFWGLIACVKASHKYIRPGGSVTLTSGTVALRPIKDWAIASGMAGGTEALTRGLALDLAPIRVNCVIPGFVATEMWAAHHSEEEQQKLFESTGKRLPLGKVGTPDDVAECYLYCMKAGFTTGSSIVADGEFGTLHVLESLEQHQSPTRLLGGKYTCDIRAELGCHACLCCRAGWKRIIAKLARQVNCLSSD